jgi:hypothetical protein
MPFFVRFLIIFANYKEKKNRKVSKDMTYVLDGAMDDYLNILRKG